MSWPAIVQTLVDVSKYECLAGCLHTIGYILFHINEYKGNHQQSDTKKYERIVHYIKEKREWKVRICVP